MAAIRSLTKLLLFEKSSLRFALGVWLGLSFSIAVILGTIGVMDGFDLAMRKALRSTNGDLYIYGRSGFFTFDEQDEKIVKEAGANYVSSYIQSQAFLVAQGISRGVSVRGIDEDSFNELTNLNIILNSQEVAVGSELMKALNIKVGDEIVLALAKGNKQISSLPLLERFRVSSVVHHGIYEKDLRFIYMPKSDLAALLSLDDRINAVAVKINDRVDLSDEEVEDTQFLIEEELGSSFRVIPYWFEYSSLLKAVEIQKVSIAVILQVIVVVSIFNVLAFITFLNTRRSKDIFLYQALGMNRSHLMRTWILVVLIFWLSSCVTSVVFVHFFDYLLQNLSLFELPGSVYNLARLNIVLSTNDYLIVFLSSLFWLLAIVYAALWKIRRQPILRGLRQEFS